jgi:hypothetical protein
VSLLLASHNQCWQFREDAATFCVVVRVLKRRIQGLGKSPAKASIGAGDQRFLSRDVHHCSLYSLALSTGQIYFMFAMAQIVRENKEREACGYPLGSTPINE